MKRIIICILIGVVIGVIATLTIVLLCNWDNIIDPNQRYGIPEMIYYITQPVGVLSTVLAVVVAIFGTDIKNRILSGKCIVSMDQEGFTEYLGDTEGTQSPKAHHYEATIRLSNTGVRQLKDCELKLLEVEYKDNSSKSQYRKLKMNNSRTIYWQQQSEKRISLRESESVTKVLARIYPSGADQTPDSSNSSVKRMSITGFSDKLNGNDKKGSWRIKYAVMTPEKTIARFQMEIYWNGDWYDRINEMNNCTSVELKNLK